MCCDATKRSLVRGMSPRVKNVFLRRFIMSRRIGVLVLGAATTLLTAAGPPPTPKVDHVCRDLIRHDSQRPLLRTDCQPRRTVPTSGSMPFPDVPRCYRCSMVPTLATTSCRTPSRTSTVSAHRRGPGRPAGGVLHTVTEVIRMIEILQPTSEPGWVLDHEGYSVLTENAVATPGPGGPRGGSMS